MLLEEPISNKNRGIVSSINKEGISYYERRDYQAAITCFKKAKKTFPNHIGIRLNLVQAFEGEMTENNIEIGIVRQVDNKKTFTVLSPAEVKDYLSELEG